MTLVSRARVTRPVRLLVVAVAAVLVATVVAVVGPGSTGSASAARQPVLGRAGVYVDGVGWGTVRPRAISNGGVPSGTASDIRWRTWGGTTARGRGLTPIYRPEGGYYSRPGAIVFRATDLGRCSPGGPRAYRTLWVRIADRPGEAPGPTWHRWPDICGS